MSYQLDTSGVVVAHGYRRVGATPVTSYEWSDLSPFCQGYIEAMFADDGTQDALMDEHGRVRQGFRQLAPATLSRIIADCEARCAAVYSSGSAATGQQFWNRRQSRDVRYSAFPPLTVTLGDDGLIYLREAGQ